MKFLHQHRNDILKLINSQALPEQDFAFVKKRGRIHIIHQSSQHYFAYFRKKETSINPVSQQWEHTSHFKIKVNDQPEYIAESWNSVMRQFEKWLASLDSH